MADPTPQRITADDIQTLKSALSPLVGTQFTSLSLPIAALKAVEPSQIGTTVGTLMDALLPQLDDIPQVGLQKHGGILGDREGYPDYLHAPTGFRLELKGIFVDNPRIQCKRPPTRREPSARLTQKVTVKNVDPALDAMLLIAYQLQPQPKAPHIASPTIIDLEVISMIELVEARDQRLTKGGGRWFGNFETPGILSKIGRAKARRGDALDASIYGRKESEGRDYNEDTNFGKLQRIPHATLKAFIVRCQATGLGVSPEEAAKLPEATDDAEGD